MKVIEPSVELLVQNDNEVAHVAKCARVCYGKETGNDQKLYDNLYNSKHWSMFRHQTYYYKIDTKKFNQKDIAIILDIVKENANKPGFYHYITNNIVYISVNGNWVFDNCHDCVVIDKYKVNLKDVIKEFPKYLVRYTFKVTTQISTSRELNRVSTNNIAERSTRYVYENGTICRPHWITEDDVKDWNNNKINNLAAYRYLDSCNTSFFRYKQLIENYDIHRQDARGILPLDTATICVYTYTLKEWKHILDLRYYGTTGKPHPNAKIIAGMIKDKLNELKVL